MAKLFGTDGIRGIANEKLTPELAFEIGYAAGAMLAKQHERPKVFVGRDTRISGPMLGASLAAGFCSSGTDAVVAGIVPTGAISYITRTGGYQLGCVISASHNPAPDNGIKLFAPDGTKVADDFERAIEAAIGNEKSGRPTGANVGRLIQSRSEIENYLSFLMSIIPGRLEGLTVCLDAAHGAGYELGPEVLRRLGATVIETGIHPDGMNINAEGGATKPERIQQLTKERKADVGVAFDGDADRAIFSDNQGRLINGDRTMAMWSAFYRANKQFDPAIVIGTVMTNGGFEHYAKEQGITLIRADVGDKYVRRKMEEAGALMGGEQSGHIIFSQRGPTGDGLVTMLEVLSIVHNGGKSLAHYYDAFQNWPQLLVNVQVDHKEGWESNAVLSAAIQSGEQRLGSEGRVNVRASGTQPMLRVMVEASDRSLAEEVSESIVTTMLAQLGGKIYSQVDLTNALGD